MNADSKANVLLVDDQPGKLLSYEVMLGELNENLITAASAKEALEILLKTDVAVILIDVCMPELDGFELARMIRDHPRFERTAIIFISAIHISEADSLRGYDAGAVDYVPVPVVPEVLRAKVRVFAELYRKTQLLEELNRELETRVAERTAALEASAARLLASEQGLSLALAAGNMGSWEYNLCDESWVVDEGQYRIFDIEPNAGLSSRGPVKSLFHPDDWERLLRSLRSATPDDRTFHSEVRIVRQTGEIRWCLVAAAVTFESGGNPCRVRGITIDITDRVEAERRQALLAREVDHRARNALAVVQAIVRLARASTVDEYVAGLEGRIRALALSHELLSQSRWQGADISRLVAEEFAPYQSGGALRATGDGPSIILPTGKAQSVALLIHELATNAVKYGALSVDSGHVHLQWALRDGCVHMSWIETGGPLVSKPKTKGFGTKIIEASLDRQQGDNAHFDWRPEGLHCTIVLSIATKKEETAAAVKSDDIPARRPKARQRKILVVEDEGIIGMLTTDLVSAMGHEVLGPCRNLDEGIKTACSNDLDGAILDVNLNGQPVFPLARMLAERSVPMIFLTGYEKCFVENGFENFLVLQKPVADSDLSKALTTMLAPSTSGERV